MKTVALLAATSVLLASSVFAQSSAPISAPPPPGINDPGVHAVAPAAKPVAESSRVAVRPAGNSLDLKPQALPSMRDGAAARDGKHQLPPDVSVREQGENNIQEYRRNGQVYMVVVTPKSGVPQTYMVDPQGRLVDEHGKKPVTPVMYKVLEWGKSPPAAADSTEPPPPAGGH